ncbi:hypothetical protein UPYG_G00273320 [Umbra pygmaea]|uniref:Uncharacterized protein n=1 Tax=Umbra pygmaea TaxID=75934 RepID=A0ABD0WCV9_UMBPY
MQRPAWCSTFPSSPTSPLIHTLHWFPAKVMVLAYGATSGAPPPYLQAPDRPTSSRGQLQIQQSKLFSILAPQCWNQLPLEARIAVSTHLQERSENLSL